MTRLPLPNETFIPRVSQCFGPSRLIRPVEIPQLRIVQQGRSQSLGRSLRPVLLVNSAKQRHVATKKVPVVIQGSHQDLTYSLTRTWADSAREATLAINAARETANVYTI